MRLNRVAAAALTAALALTVSSCSEPADDPAPAPTQSASPTTDATPTAPPSPTAPVTEKPKPGTASFICRDKDALTPFTGPAVTEFGDENVMDAYCEMADFFYLKGVTNLMVPKGTYEPIEFSFVKEFMTATAQKKWDATVKAALNGDSDAQTRVNLITYYDMASIVDLGYTFPQPGEALPQQVGGGVSKAQTQVVNYDGRKALAIWFTVTNNIVIKKNGKPFVFPIEKRVSAHLLPSGSEDKDHDWLLEAWNIEFTGKDIQPMSEVIKAP